VTVAALARPEGLLLLLVWNFLVLSAVQLTIRLIMAYSVRTTLLGALALSAAALAVALAYDLAVGPDPTLARRLDWAGLPLALMGLAGFLTARLVLRLKRLRGQAVAAAMMALLCGGMVVGTGVVALLSSHLQPAG
jgi:hypothetical protein